MKPSHTESPVQVLHGALIVLLFTVVQTANGLFVEDGLAVEVALNVCISRHFACTLSDA